MRAFGRALDSWRRFLSIEPTDYDVLVAQSAAKLDERKEKNFAVKTDEAAWKRQIAEQHEAMSAAERSVFEYLAK